MRLTQRHLVYLALFALFVVSVLILYIGYVSYNPINRQAYARIQRGMTEQQVEEILGGPCTNALAVPDDTLKVRNIRIHTIKTWQGAQANCTVLFDSAGLVEIATLQERPDPGLFGRFRALVGLRP
jgi:hypothetical protein